MMVEMPGTIGQYVAWGGNPPMMQPSADGSIFWGRNDISNFGQGDMMYSVYQEIDGGFGAVLHHTGDSGQGTLQLGGDGNLYAVFYVKTDKNRAAQWVQIKQYVPFNRVNTEMVLPQRYVEALERTCDYLDIP